VAWSYIELDDLQSAREWARKALAMQPDLPDGHMAMGMIALVEGDYEVARKQAARILELEADRTDAVQFAGWVELMAGDLDAAEAFIVRLEDAEVGRISDIDPAIDRAYFATVRGRPEEAREILRGFLARLGLRPDPAAEGRPPPRVSGRIPPHVHWELAAAHAILGNVGQSVRELARARENGWLNYHSTRLPFFDSVREDPRFLEVVDGMRADVRRMRQLAEAEGL
jgi:tetratricopeptide (TPR) repeat protein